MRAQGMVGLLALTVIGSVANAQGTSGLSRPSASGFKPSAGAAPSAGTGVPKPASSSSFPRPGSSSFARPATTAPVEEAAPPTEEAPVPGTNFNSGSRFGGSQFTPSAETSSPAATSTSAAGRFRGLADSPAEVMQPEPEPQPAPVTQGLSPQSRFPSSTGGTTRTLTPSASTSTLPSRTFGSGSTTTSPAASTTSSSGMTSMPRSSLPTRTQGTRVASNTPAPTTVSTPAEAASPIAEQLLKQSIEPRAQHELPGQPVSLSQVVGRGSGSAGRIRAVQTYWKLVTKVAMYHAAIDDHNLFAQMNVRQLAAADRAALAAAQLSADAAKSRAELDFINTQHELSEVAQFSDAELQALPSDVPLVSEYRTHFTTLYGSGGAPSGLRRIDRSMPYHLKNVRSRADSVVAAQQALQASVEAVSSGQATMSSLLEVHQHYCRERLAFAIAVYDYNAMIAEYALNVAPNQSAGTIVGMLIKTKPATRSATVVREDAVVRTVSSEEPLAADHAPALRGAQQGTIEYALPQQSVQYEAEEVPVQEVVEDPAIIMAEESPIYRR